MNAVICSLDSFVLPSGSKLSNCFYLAQTDCRHAKRQSSELSAGADDKIIEQALSYANWLSDWLLVASMAANNSSTRDINWMPEQTVDIPNY